MTLPIEYQHTSLDFDHFMADARDLAGLATTNMAWNMVVGVLQAFRRRLNAQQILTFSVALPPVVRALFLEGWQPNELVTSFGTADEFLAEVRSVRAEHNFSPSNAIEVVAMAVRRHVDVPSFESVLATLPKSAQSFWSAPPH